MKRNANNPFLNHEDTTFFKYSFIEFRVFVGDGSVCLSLFSRFTALFAFFEPMQDERK